MVTKSLLALALVLCPLDFASAQSSSHELGAKFAPGQTGVELVLPKPNVKLGQVIGMEIRMSLELTGSFGLENLTKASGQAGIMTFFGADISGFGGQLHAGAGDQFARSVNLQRFDGAVDFDGRSGASFNYHETSSSATQRFSGKSFSGMLGDQSDKAMTVSVTSGAVTSVIGHENFASDSQSVMKLRIQVTYLYGPAPGPAVSAPSPGLGFLGSLLAGSGSGRAGALLSPTSLQVVSGPSK